MSHPVESQEVCAVASVSGKVFPYVFQSAAYCTELMSITGVKEIGLVGDQSVSSIGTCSYSWENMGWSAPGKRSQLSVTHAPGEFADCWVPAVF